MSRKTLSIFSLFSIIFFSFVLGLGAQEESQQAVDPSLKMSADAGEQWLHLLDEGKFVESWQNGSATLKLTVPKQHWISLMESIRKPLGGKASRTLIDQKTAKDPKGLPKGDYMVLVYKTAFPKKESAHELVTLVQESDGVWRVLTYQVQ